LEQASVAAIDGARMMLLLFSQHANTAPQVTREVERAVQKDLTIIPVRIEDVRPTGDLEYFLGTPQWPDAMPPPLERHRDRIVASVKYWLPRGTATVMTPGVPTPLPRQPERSAQSPLRQPPNRPSRKVAWLNFQVATSIVLVGIVSFLAVRQWLHRRDTNSAEQHTVKVATIQTSDGHYLTAVKGEEVLAVLITVPSSSPFIRMPHSLRHRRYSKSRT
jgi:hypothetical protein